MTHQDEIEIWAKLDKAGVATDVRRLLNRECDRHTTLLRRIYTALGYKAGGPGIQMLCELLVAQRESALELACLVESMTQSGQPLHGDSEAYEAIENARNAFGGKLMDLGVLGLRRGPVDPQPQETEA